MKVDDPTPKSFLDHLEDLRWVIIKSAVVFAVAAGASLAFTKPLLQLLYEPLRRAGQDPAQMLRVLGVIDPLSIQLDLALMGGVLVALPFVLYFVGQFVLPGLTRREARALLPAFFAGALLFVGGVVFCFKLLLPQTLRFFFDLAAWQGFRTEWTVQNYVDFVLQMLLAFGLSFELPLVLVLLNVLGIVSSAGLRQYRRHTLVGLVVFASCVVPATDPFSLGTLILPMYCLYEATIWITRMLEKGRERDSLDSY
ncbi:MAG: twin-arginine translocase subunit TatC [Verrucomicrobium sp.]|nr:twin-arginine translocase subunit TatC [Verrucomicrobium sp.]